MSSTRSVARNVRQRKLNTKQGLRITREHDIEETLDDEASRQIPQLETGVEKGEEIVRLISTHLLISITDIIIGSAFAGCD